MKWNIEYFIILLIRYLHWKTSQSSERALIKLKLTYSEQKFLAGFQQEIDAFVDKLEVVVALEAADVEARRVGGGGQELGRGPFAREASAAAAAAVGDDL